MLLRVKPWRMRFGCSEPKFIRRGTLTTPDGFLLLVEIRILAAMSNYQPEDPWRYEVPPPNNYTPAGGWPTQEHRTDAGAYEKSVNMNGEAHDDSRVYMAGRDQYIRQPRDLSPVWKVLEKIWDWIFASVAFVVMIWAVYSTSRGHKNLQPILDWLKTLPFIDHYFGK